MTDSKPVYKKKVVEESKEAKKDRPNTAYRGNNRGNQRGNDKSYRGNDQRNQYRKRNKSNEGEEVKTR